MAHRSPLTPTGCWDAAGRRARLAYRDVASPTNRVTLIAAMLDARTVSTHTLVLPQGAAGSPAAAPALACFNSLVVNFLVRLRVNTHVTTAIVERLPVPREDQLGPGAFELVDAAERLGRRHEPAVSARLNAIVARSYQLDVEEFQRVLESFPLIERTERDAMLDEFRRL